MSIWDSIILGVVQGFTEFLPVSSSGHLVVMEHFLGLKFQSLTFEVIVHFGTFLAVVIAFRKEIISLIIGFFRGLFSKNVISNIKLDSDFRVAVYIIIGTIPAVIVGLFLKDQILAIFHNLNLVGITLIITGVILFITRIIYIGNKRVSLLSSVIVGISQAFAVLPGISRSGVTISTGLFMGLSRTEAVKFSFLLSLPAILGANVLELMQVGNEESSIPFLFYLVGFVSAFISGFIAIKVLIKMVQTGRFSLFSIYCISLGILILIFL
ncbi:MAG: undecaprenyl-diphosphate phosphatase [Candidatus Marinimicrobia bacterium]|nr:undecaprenyl-diphosphate phosphatase [Candidatus Neomarinimicrobiota bacterium]